MKNIEEYMESSTEQTSSNLISRRDLLLRSIAVCGATFILPITGPQYAFGGTSTPKKASSDKNGMSSQKGYQGTIPAHCDIRHWCGATIGYDIDCGECKEALFLNGLDKQGFGIFINNLLKFGLVLAKRDLKAIIQNFSLTLSGVKLDEIAQEAMDAYRLKGGNANQQRRQIVAEYLYKILKNFNKHLAKAITYQETLIMAGIVIYGYPDIQPC